MSTHAVITSGGKQYVVAKGQEVVVDKIASEVGSKVELPILLSFEGGSIELGTPHIERKALAEVLETGKGKKIRVSKFKSKVRYRKTTGFRPALTKLRILSI